MPRICSSALITLLQPCSELRGSPGLLQILRVSPHWHFGWQLPLVVLRTDHPELHFLAGAQSKIQCTCFSGSRHGIKAILGAMATSRLLAPHGAFNCCGPWVLVVLFFWADTNSDSTFHWVQVRHFCITTSDVPVPASDTNTRGR